MLWLIAVVRNTVFLLKKNSNLCFTEIRRKKGRINPAYQLELTRTAEVKSPERVSCLISSVLTFAFFSPANPVMCVSPIYRLQQNRDWLLCACRIRWEFKKERSPSAFKTSIQSRSSPLCQGRQNEEVQTDGRTSAGEKSGSFLLTTIRHRGKQSALQPLLTPPPRNNILSQRILCTTDTEISKEPGTWGENIQQGSNQILPTLYALCTVGESPISTLQRIKSQAEISFIYFSCRAAHERSPGEVNSWLQLTVVRFPSKSRAAAFSQLTH